MEHGFSDRGLPVSFAAIALFGLSVATLLLGFLGYRAATFRAGGDDTRRMGPRRL